MQELVLFPCWSRDLAALIREVGPHAQVLSTRAEGDPAREVSVDELDDLADRYDDDRVLELVELDADGHEIAWSINEERGVVPLLESYENERSRRAG